MNGIQMYDKTVIDEETKENLFSDSYWSNKADDAATYADYSNDYLETEW